MASYTVKHHFDENSIAYFFRPPLLKADGTVKTKEEQFQDMVEWCELRSRENAANLKRRFQIEEENFQSRMNAVSEASREHNALIIKSFKEARPAYVAKKPMANNIWKATD
jgi:hypothetical protein